ncbi:hypothetical protein TOK_3295 [Pseudonocardia sp. N23]|nr:hypothetical protein TOK_3295 [Pseudonocardia sp. N23]
MCRACGATAHVDQVPGVAAHLDPADAAGYRVETAVVVFRGLCAACSRAGAAGHRLPEASAH